MNEWKITKERAVAELEKIIAQIKDGTFEGVLAFSNLRQKIGFALAEKGFAEDRINAIDAIFYSVYEEPNVEARKWTMVEMYKRWKHYFPNLSFNYDYPQRVICLRCPECEEEIDPLNMDDEDEWWVECPKCHATWGHSIKPGFG